MEKQQQNAQLQQEDALEEVREDEFEGELELSDYLLIFEVDAEWPYDKEHYCFQGKYAYPLFLTEQAIKPCFPHFNNFFEVEGVDRIKGVITIVVHNGKVDKTLEIALNESVYYDFCYATNKLKKSSLRKGRARFSFYHFDFNDVVIPGKIVINEVFTVNGVEEVNETNTFTKISEKEDEAGYIDLESGDRVHICLTDYTNNFVLLYTFRDNPKAPDGADTVYVPLFLNRENVETVSYFNDKEKEKRELKTRIYYIEGVVDKADPECVLKIHESSSHRDTYNESNKEEDYEMEVVDRAKLKLNHSNVYVHISRVDKSAHEYILYIGESSTPFDNRFYLVNLKQKAEYKYQFSGGYNDNYHADSVIVTVEVIKK